MIRTCDLYHPKVALYQAELRPDDYTTWNRIHNLDGFVKVDGMRGSRLASWEMSFVLQMTHLSSSAFPAGEGFERGIPQA